MKRRVVDTVGVDPDPTLMKQPAIQIRKIEFKKKSTYRRWSGSVQHIYLEEQSI